MTRTNNPVRRRRPRRELPEDLTDLFIAEGDRPSDLDVIAGRGGGSNHHEGNKRYWRRILMERPGYKKLGKNDNTEKNQIAAAIYDYILLTGGRFLQIDTKTKKWFNIPKKISLDKIKQALRDKYVPHFAQEGPQTPTVCKPLPTPMPPLLPMERMEQEKRDFLQFLNNAPAPAQSQKDLFSTSSMGSMGLTSFFQQICKSSSLGKVDSPKFSLSQDFGQLYSSNDLFQIMTRPSQTNIQAQDDDDDDFDKTVENLPGLQIEQDYPMVMKPTTFELGRGMSLDLMREDLITRDNLQMMDQTPTRNSSVRPKSSLESLLQQQMEAAFSSSSRNAGTVAV